MNYIKHLTGFFDRISRDDKLNPTHISLYISLFQYWNINRFQNPISISRSEIMKISKISAKGTYHKCMKDLHQSGYIKYQPSYNPFKGSLVFLTPFDDVQTSLTRRQLMNQQQTGTEQALIPSINNSNITNKEKHGRPQFSEVDQYFKQKKYPPTESKKFYNHYKSIGWKIQGITPIEDWKALAEKWMENATKWNGQVQPAASPAPTLDQLYLEYRSGQHIYQKLTKEHFTELNLNITQDLINRARNERIKQVAGTNQHSLNQLWDAYLKKDYQNPLVIKDRPKIEFIAQRFAILNHFKTLNMAGSTSCHPEPPKRSEGPA